MIQGDFPTATGIGGDRLGHAQGEGQQMPIRIVHGAHPAIEAATGPTGQLAGHQPGVRGGQAQILQ
jgi:hypothetical protein